MPAVMRYHEIKAPMGKLFDDQSLVPEGESWVDSPRKITGAGLQEAADIAAVKRRLDIVLKRYSALATALEDWMTAPREELGAAEDRLREVAAEFVTLVGQGDKEAVQTPEAPRDETMPPQEPTNVDAFMSAYVVDSGLKRDTYEGSDKDRDKLLKIGVQQYIASRHHEEVDGRYSLEKTLELARNLDEESAAQSLSDEETL